MKKLILIVLCSLVFIFVVYFGIIKNGFSYFTGFGTEYSYFKAKAATKDSILTIYSVGLDEYIVNPINSDSVMLLYGFRSKNAGHVVSYSVMKLYNSIIQEEIEKRLGKRWDEYLFKVDSLQNIADSVFDSTFLK